MASSDILIGLELLTSSVPFMHCLESRTLILVNFCVERSLITRYMLLTYSGTSVGFLYLKEVFPVKPLMREIFLGMGTVGRTYCRYRFSAFWLRSSVVSVLISLISDTSPTRGPYIKLIFGTGRWKRGLPRPLHASTWYCSTSRTGAPLSHCEKQN